MSDKDRTGGEQAESNSDELTLDKETVKDLDPTGEQQDAVKGGSSIWGTCGAHCSADMRQPISDRGILSAASGINRIKFP